MSESDGKNESQLLEWADLRTYLDTLIVLRVHMHLPWHTNVMQSSLLLWLLWMTISRSKKLY